MLFTTDSMHSSFASKCRTWSCASIRKRCSSASSSRNCQYLSSVPFRPFRPRRAWIARIASACALSSSRVHPPPRGSLIKLQLALGGATESVCTPTCSTCRRHRKRFSLECKHRSCSFFAASKSLTRRPPTPCNGSVIRREHLASPARVGLHVE